MITAVEYFETPSRLYLLDIIADYLSKQVQKLFPYTKPVGIKNTIIYNIRHLGCYCDYYKKRIRRVSGQAKASILIRLGEYEKDLLFNYNALAKYNFSRYLWEDLQLNESNEFKNFDAFFNSIMNFDADKEFWINTIINSKRSINLIEKSINSYILKTYVLLHDEKNTISAYVCELNIYISKFISNISSNDIVVTDAVQESVTVPVNKDLQDLNIIHISKNDQRLNLLVNELVLRDLLANENVDAFISFVSNPIEYNSTRIIWKGNKTKLETILHDIYSFYNYNITKVSFARLVSESFVDILNVPINMASVKTALSRVRKDVKRTDQDMTKLFDDIVRKEINNKY